MRPPDFRNLKQELKKFNALQIDVRRKQLNIAGNIKVQDGVQYCQDGKTIFDKKTKVNESLNTGKITTRLSKQQYDEFSLHQTRYR